VIGEGTPLSAELEAKLLRELMHCYGWHNTLRFGDRLIPPVLVLSDSHRRLGSWHAATRTLALARTLVLERPWPEVSAVLEHEMAHQFVDEVLGVRGETAHGETYARVCAERGIDARAAGAPVPSSDADGDRVLDRIRKLLALAGSPNQHEAELAMRKAHELMLRHNIAAAAAHANRGYEVRHLGDPSRRISRVESQVVGLLAEFFFVKAIRTPVYVPRLGRRGALFEVSGTRPNVEMACHVHAFLLATAARLWRDNRGDARVRSGRDRVSYESGVIDGFRAKLASERAELSGTGLVWRGDGDLERFYRTRHPRIVTRRTTARLTAAHVAGREAGGKVVLNRPVEEGATAVRRRLEE
jgi:hypothetical protein